ncbi:MAG: DUF4230 domain-containing protein [Dysgonomonas sp.]|nr:DUF4230 domain-containing protein [Dysgonomonas sp.]
MNRRRGNITILMAGIIIGILAMYIFSSKDKKEDKVQISHDMVMEKIESLGNLEVLKYSIRDIMEYKKMRQWLPNAKTAMIVSGEVIYCIDLTKLRPEDIYTSADSIRLQLPAPEVCHVKVDHSRSKVYNMEYGLWESEKIVDEAYRHAEKQLEEQATKIDMQVKSRSNTIDLLKPILQAMGFEHVLISFRNVPSSE